jgi:hypothetical protein
MYEILGLLVIILPTLIANYHFGDFCEAGKTLAALGLGFCYILGIFTIKRIWED